MSFPAEGTLESFGAAGGFPVVVNLLSEWITHDPEVALFCFACSFLQVGDWGFVNLKRVCTAEFLSNSVVNVCEEFCGEKSPFVEGLAADLGCKFTQEHLALAILREVIAVFGDDDVYRKRYADECARYGCDGGWVTERCLGFVSFVFVNVDDGALPAEFLVLDVEEVVVTLIDEFVLIRVGENVFRDELFDDFNGEILWIDVFFAFAFARLFIFV